ncbi:MAG: DNA translocase FtsK [Smithella sp.]
MSEIHKYEGYKKRLQGVCDENDLVFRFKHDSYPITLTISPATVNAEQIELFESAKESGHISPDAAIEFAYEDGELTYTTSEIFTISDTLFNKIKNLYKNMHSLWLQFFYRDIMERGTLKATDMPHIESNEDSSDNSINGSMPLEEADEEAAETSEDESGTAEDDADGTETDNPPGENEEDPLLQQAINLVREAGYANIALLRRNIGIEREKASELINTLETLGVIGPGKGSARRENLPYEQNSEYEYDKKDE